jgi:peptidoglycan-N-acetylglucosamine deacetylase
MSRGDHGDRGRPARPLLSAGELSARRAAWRRERRRRRWAAAIGVLGAGALVAAVVTISSGGSSPHPTAAAPPPATPGADPFGRHRAAVAPGRPPNQARSVDRVLGYTSYVQLAGHRRRDVALTFDDGPSPYTPQILGVLRRMHAVATFFVIGRSARLYPQYVADEARAGDEVGDHTEDHPPLGELSSTAQTDEIAEAGDAIHAAGAPYPVLLRPPYGSFNQTTLEVLRAQRMLMVLWSADTSDYLRPGVSKIIYTAVSGGESGAIILMHDGGGDRSETVAALPRIIVRLRQRGFRLVTISQLVAADPPPASQPPPTPLSGGV